VIESEAIHNALTFLLDHLPGNMHLVIASRADPPLPIARLRGRGQLTELRATDLCFTLDEVTEFHECFDEIRVIRPFVIFVFQNRDLPSRVGGCGGLRREPVLSLSKGSAERFSPALPSTETVLPGGTSSAIMQPC
jgi:hypothetical protein